MAGIYNVLDSDKFSPSNFFELSLYETSESQDVLMSYAFYVSPEGIDISQPSRVAVYQSINGKTFVDHLGGGVATISIEGTTGLNRHPNHNGYLGFGYVSYVLLRSILDKYNNLCQSGKTATTRLTLVVATEDAPDYGQWDVTLQALSLSRSTRSPLMFRYKLSFIALSPNLLSADLDVAALSQASQIALGSTITYPPTWKNLQEAAKAGLENVDVLVPPSVVEYEIQLGDNLDYIAGLYYSNIDYGKGMIRGANPQISDWSKIGVNIGLVKYEQLKKQIVASPDPSLYDWSSLGSDIASQLTSSSAMLSLQNSVIEQSYLSASAYNALLDQVQPGSVARTYYETVTIKVPVPNVIPNASNSENRW